MQGASFSAGLPPVLAVDIALALPADPAGLAIRLNRSLKNPPGSKTSLKLGNRHCVPHITLAMAAVPQPALPEIRDAISSMAEAFLPATLEMAAVAVVRTPSGDLVSGIDIAMDETVLAMHREAMGVLGRHRTGQVDSACFSGEQVDAGIVEYVRGFDIGSAFERYSPHVTLGLGDASTESAGIPFPVRFECTELLLCHIGAHGSCRVPLSRHR
jgi:hypothetical protein